MKQSMCELKKENAEQKELIQQVALLLTNLQAPLYIQSLLHAVDNFSSLTEVLPELRYVNQLLYRQGLIFEAFGAREKIISYTINDEQFYRMAIEKAIEQEDYENAAILKRAREFYASEYRE